MSANVADDPPTGAARHVAIIADGNGRWARARGLSASEGYNAGADTLKARLRDAVELGIEQLTVYSFSTENWSRPAAEVHQLICVLARRITAERPSCTDTMCACASSGAARGSSASSWRRSRRPRR